MKDSSSINLKAPIFSFSRLSSWDTCKHAWKRNYIEGDKGEDNFFNTFGTLGHSVLEKVDRGLITPKDAFEEWNSRYDTEVVPHSVHWMDNWKQEADRFFQNFKGWRTEPVWVEHHFVLDMDGYRFQGHVDRLGRAANGDLIMTDYKCAKPYEGTNLKEKARQLYLYAEAVRQEFHEWPTKLIFFHFRQNIPVIIPFKLEDFEEAMEWMERTVRDIETYSGNYHMQDNGYFCEAVCGYRNSCTKQFEI